ncbi:Tm-1-like ATP-binding domain-containing protein, partial [Candidatus Aerophobetes bacterium]|nr:Tm-1-like ATP-binding domain-containing protein [Candidatus Aerophobetes bacterium]
MEKKTIIVLATLDTKGKEAQFVKEEIENRGHRVVVIDTGVVGKPYFEADISREE